MISAAWRSLTKRFCCMKRPIRDRSRRHQLPWVALMCAWLGAVFTQAQSTNPNLPPGLEVDEEMKRFNAKEGDTAAKFQFAVKNTTESDVVIEQIITSCGCTTGELPEDPWVLSAGESGTFDVTMDLHGRTGVVTKSVFVRSNLGIAKLKVQSIIPQGAAIGGMTERRRNQLLALRDRTAIFKGRCVQCHVRPTVDKLDKDLYETACGVCHESENRATMVPDLRELKKETNAEYWEKWVREGRQGSLMPGFDRKHGGPLDDEQVDSLVRFLESGGLYRLGIDSELDAAGSRETSTEDAFGSVNPFELESPE